MADGNSEQMANAGVRFPPPLVYLGFLLIGVAIDRQMGWRFGLVPPVGWLIAATLALFGALFIIGALGLFRRAGTAAPPWLPASTLVTGGVYRATRNPMYLGMALVALALAVIVGGWASLAAVMAGVIAIDRFVIAREEPYLAALFGAEYTAYCARVRRWL